MPLPTQILKRLDSAIWVADQFLFKLKSRTDWQTVSFLRPFPLYLADFSDSAKGLLLDLGRVGSASLRRIAKEDFRPFVTDESGRWVATDETLKEYSGRMQLLKAELEKARAKLLGIGPTVRQKKAPGPIGRPKKAHIDEALRLLREGMRKYTAKFPEPRERWEWIFKNVICALFEKKVWPKTIEGWAGTELQEKKAEKNLRDALRARRGMGVPPPLKTPSEIN